MKSLLGNNISRFSIKPEDFMTEGLVYLFNSKNYVKNEFLNLLSSLCNVEISNDIFFKTQVSGENNERPDIIGVNSKNEEILIGELKFWAGLTVNQPVTYLHRLLNSKNITNKVLFFICPTMRVELLKSELIRKCKNEGIPFKMINEFCFLIEGSLTYLLLFDYKKLFSILENSFIRENERILLSDLYQLIGLSDKMDEEAFIPLKSEEFSPEFGKRVFQIYKLVDSLADSLKINFSVSSDGLKATPQYAGYSRYLRKNNIGINLQLNFKYWYEICETPLWIGLKIIRDKNWIYSPDIKEKLIEYENSIPKRLFTQNEQTLIPLFISMNKEEEYIIKELATTINDILEKVINLE